MGYLSITPEEQADHDAVWESVSRTEWSFSPEMDVTNNYHMVREIVLGQSLAWGEVHRRYKPQPGHRIMDIGANVGIYSGWAASRKAHVVAYEPNPQAFPFLSKAAPIAGFESRECAIVGSVFPPPIDYVTYFGQKKYIGSVPFYNGGTDSVVPWSDAEKSSSIEVPAITLSTALGGFDWDFVKIDIEGGEFGLIMQTTIDLLKTIRRCYMEIHPWLSDNAYASMMMIMNDIWKVDILTREPDRPHRADAVYLERPE